MERQEGNSLKISSALYTRHKCRNTILVRVNCTNGVHRICVDECMNAVIMNLLRSRRQFSNDANHETQIQSL